MWRAPWRSPCEAMRPEWSRWRNWFSDVRIASQAPNQPPKTTCIISNQPHLNSPFNVCVLLSSVWVDSHVQLLQLRAGAVPLIVWRQSELLGASCSAWTQSAAHSEWGRPSTATEVRSTQVLRLVGGEQQQQADNSCCFTTSQLQKSCFHLPVFFLLLPPGWHTYCDVNLELVLLCGSRSFAEPLKVSQ